MVALIFDYLVSYGVEDFTLRYAKFLSARKAALFFISIRVFISLESYRCILYSIGRRLFDIRSTDLIRLSI